MNNELAKLSQDLYFNKNMVFNNVSGDEAMRNLINEKLGQPAGTKRIDYFAWEEKQSVPTLVYCSRCSIASSNQKSI